MEKYFEIISGYVWSYALIGLCIFSGVYFTIRTGFLQFRYLKSMVRLLFSGGNSAQGISPFQAFSLAISGRVGTGNIIGVASAISFGGPGAVFWMWVIALLGATSAFAEATLGQVYKQEIKGQYRGGPAYYIEKGLGIKWYAVFFALVAILSCGFLLPGIQSNSIVTSLNQSVQIPNVNIAGYEVHTVGVAIIILVSIIIFGGVKRLGKVTQIIVPFMAVSYIVMVLIIIGMHFSQIPDVFMLIIDAAFSSESIYAGITGSAIAWGVKRGIYSNEAGQGTAPHAAAASEVKHPVEQGLVQAFSVYVDTLFICTATAFMILFTGKYNVINEKTEIAIVENIPSVEYSFFTQEALNIHFPVIGSHFVALALFFFAFTTILAYYYYAETNIAYIFKGKRNAQLYIWILRIGFLYGVYMGAIKEAKLAWTVGDIGVGLMAWVNVVAILLLSGVIIRVWKDYVSQRKKGIKNPIFDPKKSNIKNSDFWNP